MTKFSIANDEQGFSCSGEWEVSAGVHVVACGPKGVANAITHLLTTHAPLGETEMVEIVAVIRKLEPDQCAEIVADPSRN